MFDNPEKLFIIMLIALFIFGPQKLIGLGGAMGRAVRDFRGAVRNAQEEFRSAADEVRRTAEWPIGHELAALPAPALTPPAADVPAPAVPAASQAGAPAPGPSDSHSPASGSDYEGSHSLASEPPAQVVLESLTRKE